MIKKTTLDKKVAAAIEVTLGSGRDETYKFILAKQMLGIAKRASAEAHREGKKGFDFTFKLSERRNPADPTKATISVSFKCKHNTKNTSTGNYSFPFTLTAKEGRTK